jgi:hypothetical protein
MRPSLKPGMTLAEFRAYYWMKADLIQFARQLEIATTGYKPELVLRIEQRLKGLLPELPKKQSTGPRDSDKKLQRKTPVVSYWSDAKTRAFFESEIGPEFHFTSHMNQYRLAHSGLTYGDLVDVWVKERDRRRNPNYKATIAEHGKYNRFIRDYFADPRNKGKPLRDAAASWNAIKTQRGDPRYKRR